MKLPLLSVGKVNLLAAIRHSRIGIAYRHHDEFPECILASLSSEQAARDRLDRFNAPLPQAANGFYFAPHLSLVDDEYESWEPILPKSALEMLADQGQ